MTPLNILLPVHCFFPDHFYGTETYTLELAQRLKAMGHNPTILTAILYGEKGTGKSPFTYEYGGLTVDCIDLNTMPLKNFRQLFSQPELYPVLTEIIQRRHPDIVHVTHLMGHTAVLLEVIRDLQIPSIATLTDFFGICPNSKLMDLNGGLCRGPNRRSTNCLSCYIREHDYEFSASKTLKWLIRHDLSLGIVSSLIPYVTGLSWNAGKRVSRDLQAAVARFDYLRDLYEIYACMITPTDLLHDAYVANGFYPEKLKKINFGINLDLVKPYRHVMREIPSKIRFGYIGQMASHKGVDLMIQAFSSVKGDKATLSVYGPQNQDAAYQAYLNRLAEGTNGISFENTFPQDQLGKVLSGIDVLVIPSRWHENSPLVLLYALAMKTPVIVSDMKGMTEFVKDGYNGFIFPKDSVAQLKQIMQRIVDMPEILLPLSDNADYSMDTRDHVDEVCRIYQNVLAT